jgi:hypothetical protein
LGKPETSTKGNSRLTGEGQIYRKATRVGTADQKKERNSKEDAKTCYRKVTQTGWQEH